MLCSSCLPCFSSNTQCRGGITHNEEVQELLTAQKNSPLELTNMVRYTKYGMELHMENMCRNDAGLTTCAELNFIEISFAVRIMGFNLESHWEHSAMMNTMMHAYCMEN